MWSESLNSHKRLSVCWSGTTLSETQSASMEHMTLQVPRDPTSVSLITWSTRAVSLIGGVISTFRQSSIDWEEFILFKSLLRSARLNFIDLLTTISRNISKRIWKLIAKVSAPSWHHSQGKVYIVIIFISLKNQKLCTMRIVVSVFWDEESRKDVYREKEISISRGGEMYFERRREVYR